MGDLKGVKGAGLLTVHPHPYTISHTEVFVWKNQNLAIHSQNPWSCCKNHWSNSRLWFFDRNAFLSLNSNVAMKKNLKSSLKSWNFLTCHMHFDNPTWGVLRGYYTPYLKLACFVHNLKIINTFLKKYIYMHLKANCLRNSKMALKI